MYLKNKYIIIKNQMEKNIIENLNTENLNIENKIIKRENKLIFEFNEHKIGIPNKYFGDIYAYIHYGKPSLKLIIKNEINKISLKRKRRIKLNNELKKINIPLDESLTSCIDYINNRNNKTLSKTIRKIEIEYFLKYQTKIDEYKKILDKENSSNESFQEYIKNINININNNILKFIKNEKKIKICFD
jgi:hypothetical protein